MFSTDLSHCSTPQKKGQTWFLSSVIKTSSSRAKGRVTSFHYKRFQGGQEVWLKWWNSCLASTKGSEDLSPGSSSQTQPPSCVAVTSSCNNWAQKIHTSLQTLWLLLLLWVANRPSTLTQEFQFPVIIHERWQARLSPCKWSKIPAPSPFLTEMGPVLLTPQHHFQVASSLPPVRILYSTVFQAPGKTTP
jgi:hypothetical protein